MLKADALGEVKQRVDQGQADRVRLGAGGRGTGQPGTGRGELLVDGSLVRTVSPAANEQPRKFRECAETEQIRGLSAEPAVLGGRKAREVPSPAINPEPDQLQTGRQEPGTRV